MYVLKGYCLSRSSGACHVEHGKDMMSLMNVCVSNKHCMQKKHSFSIMLLALRSSNTNLSILGCNMIWSAEVRFGYSPFKSVLAFLHFAKHLRDPDHLLGLQVYFCYIIYVVGKNH